MSGGTTASGALAYGDLVVVPLGAGETAEVEVTPARGFDLGNGPGKPITRTAKGGPAGIILDARGRRLELPEDAEQRRQAVTRMVKATGMYDDLEVASNGA
jgi:hypothetical protein